MNPAQFFERIQTELPAFRSRPQQLEMGEFIAGHLKARDTRRVAVVEAPTGVGKTLGYLSACVQAALDSHKKLIISTATVNLQQQLIHKDLPQVAGIFETPLVFMQIKGRRRYLCPSKLMQVSESSSQRELVPGLNEQARERRRLQAQQLVEQWQKDWDGDRDSLDMRIDSAVWSDVSTDSEGCAGKRCSQYVECPYYRLRREMQNAQVLVANHDVVLSDADLGGGLVLPQPEDAIFVFDEAHKLPHKAQDHAAKQLDFQTLYQTIDIADNVLKKLPNALGSRQHDIGLMMRSLYQALPQVMNRLLEVEQLLESSDVVNRMREGKLSEPRLFWLTPLMDSLMTPFQSIAQACQEIYRHFVLFGRWIRDALDKLEIPAKRAESLLPQVGQVQNTIGYLIDFMSLFLAEDKPDSPPNVRWLSLAGQDAPRLIMHAGPMTAASFLRQTLWERCHAAVLTSATLRGMGLFQRFRSDCGLTAYNKQHFLAVDSPFDYSTQAILHVPPMQNSPGEQQESWLKEVGTRVNELIDPAAATLVLFTARSAMSSVYQQLPSDLQKQVLLQDSTQSARQMVAEHTRRIEAGQGSIIFGLERFAEGVDLPGELCTHVIITKLPFPVFTRPIEQARQEWVIQQGGQPFVALSLPAVSIKLIQACGRLLRKETDAGRITLLDRRILTKAYGKQLLKHLPGYRLQTD